MEDEKLDREGCTAIKCMFLIRQPKNSVENVTLKNVTRKGKNVFKNIKK